MSSTFRQPQILREGGVCAVRSSCAVRFSGTDNSCSGIYSISGAKSVLDVSIALTVTSPGGFKKDSCCTIFYFFY